MLAALLVIGGRLFQPSCNALWFSNLNKPWKVFTADSVPVGGFFTFLVMHD